MPLVNLNRRLLEAACSGQEDGVWGLMSNSTSFTTDWKDANAKDTLKMTVLHWATKDNHQDVMELLV